MGDCVVLICVCYLPPIDSCRFVNVPEYLDTLLGQIYTTVNQHGDLLCELLINANMSMLNWRNFRIIRHSTPLMSTSFCLNYQCLESQEWTFDGFRSQSVMFVGHLSGPLPVNIGVPQGSILSPLFFLLYLNDLPTIAQDYSVNMYADDTEIENMCKPYEHIQLENSLNNNLCRLK